MSANNDMPDFTKGLSDAIRGPSGKTKDVATGTTNGAANGTAKAHKPVMLFTNPRTASNLLQKLLSKQDGFEHSGYIFFDASFNMLFQLLNSGPAKDAAPEEWQKHMDAYQACFEKFLAAIEEHKQQGRATFHKEHIDLMVDPIKLFKAAYPDDEGPNLAVRYPGQETPPKSTSPLCLPDDFLTSILPVILIRNPALMVPSFYRAQNDCKIDLDSAHFRCFMELQWTWQLYDWYCSQGVTPIVVDGDDVMKQPAVVRKLCELCGMDPDKIMWEWEQEEAPENPLANRFKSTLINSKGIISGKDSADLNIEEECKKWEAEFGQEVGGRMKTKVETSMPYYQKLRERRLQA
ncbi:hypothetical protein KC315_g13523 [Hortaea werneckii]|nr:hypothetical protein KC315_g13523 [Hortaea werneckii]